MAKTKIEWADYTFNPWIGCTRVSPGCDNCYAERQNKHWQWTDKWGPKGTRKRTSEANWKKPLTWNRKAAREGVHYKVFCASLADVFDNDVRQQWRDDLWNLIRNTPNLDYFLLTKRPENMTALLPNDWDHGMTGVWLGVTVENQEQAENRIPILLQIPAKKRFVSVEPMLGLVRLTWLDTGTGNDYFGMNAMKTGARNPFGKRLDWVIVGGESGPKARPMDDDWVRLLRDHCQQSDTPFFYKQKIAAGKKITMPKLDGRVWDQVPGVGA